MTERLHFHFSLSRMQKMATHSNVLAWRIPGTGEPGGLPSMGSHRVRHDWSDSAAEAAAYNIVTLLICAVCVPCAQLYSSPCDPLNCSSPGSSVHGTLQARILEWVAIPCSRGTSRPRDQTQVSHCGQILYRLSHQGSPTCEPDQ